MRRTGVADLPLHGGKAPRWLFSRMVKLARAISLVIIREFGVEELLDRLAHPFWFQAFGCVLGFDWHSSGLTTTVCGALKEGLKTFSLETGLFICGGKAQAARNTPQEIERWILKASLSDEFKFLLKASRLAAKVDNTALQDGFYLYHHTFFFTKNGKWVVIQQGMNENSRYARRYHWLSKNIKSFVCEPHTGIISPIKASNVLNLVAKESIPAQKSLCKLCHISPDKFLKELKSLPYLYLPARHSVSLKDLHPKGLSKVFLSLYERNINSFEELLLTKGLGPKSLRALALTSELIYDTPISRKDPARYSFAHGGKDGHPYPVDRKVYDKTINYLEELLLKARLGYYDRERALRRLQKFNFFV